MANFRYFSKRPILGLFEQSLKICTCGHSINVKIMLNNVIFEKELILKSSKFKTILPCAL